MGVGCGITDSHILLWRREKIKQWPPSTERYPVLYVFKDAFGNYISHVEPPGLHPEAVPYYAGPRVKDMNTDEKWYHYGYMFGGVIKDIGWAVLCLCLMNG